MIPIISARRLRLKTRPNAGRNGMAEFGCAAKRMFRRLSPYYLAIPFRHAAPQDALPISTAASGRALGREGPEGRGRPSGRSQGDSVRFAGEK